jgi:hypothetical protein
LKVALIEFTDEFQVFQVFLKKKNLRLEDFVIVALEPRVQAYLKNRGIQYLNTLPYFQNESHKKIIVESEKIMTYLRAHFDFADSNGLINCYETEFSSHIRLYLNHIFKMLEILENIYLENRNVEIFAFVCHSRTSSVMINDSERYLGDLAERFAKKRGLQFTNVAETITKDEKKPLSKTDLKKFEKRSTKALLFLLRNKKVIFVPVGGGLFKKLLSQIFQSDKGMVFLAIGHSRGIYQSATFNVYSFLRSIIDPTYCPYYLVSTTCFLHPDNKEQARLMTSIDSIMRPQNTDLFEYNCIGYQDLMRDKVDIALKSHMSRMVLQSHNLRYFFNNFRNRMVISFSALGVMAVAGELARKMGINSLFISHGAHPVPVDSFHETELSNLCRGFMLSEYTHIALSTPVQEEHLEYFRRKYPWVENRNLKTGPLVFAHVVDADKAEARRRLGIPSVRTVLTHAMTTKARHGERFYFLETFDELFSSLSDVIRVLNESTRLIVRIHPGFYLTNEEIRTLLPESDRYIIHREGTFADVLAATDVLISYSSTAIDEALINRMPVILYDKWNRYSHFRTSPYEDARSPDIFPVCYVNKREKLSDAVRDVVTRAEQSQKKDVDVAKYCYDGDYRENLYAFIRESLS